MTNLLIAVPVAGTSAGLLFDRKVFLGMQKNIQDMERYAQDWADLAADFESIGYLSNAEYCKSRAVYYAGLGVGSFVRVMQGNSLVDLIPLS